MIIRKTYRYLWNKMQGIMQATSKRRAHMPQYISSKQLTLEGFETLFSKELNPNNRWVVLVQHIP